MRTAAAGAPSRPMTLQVAARWMFLFFFVSGFCSLVYELVWLRLAMASFGVTTPLVSIVLSVFMAGLAIGSWMAGRLCRGWAAGATPLRVYALAELWIGASAFVVPGALRAGATLLLGADAPFGSSLHYAVSGLWVALVLVPFCLAMGATLPLGMAFLERTAGPGVSRSFSHLYLANVLGATCGTLLSAMLMVELLGFTGTLRATALLNVLLAVLAWVVAGRVTREPAALPAASHAGAPLPLTSGSWPLVALATTGLASMGMEIVWMRIFTPYLGTEVYAFATVLALYLGTTALGSWSYRVWARLRTREHEALGSAWAALALLSLLPAALADPRLGVGKGIAAGAPRVALAIAPFCFLAGFLTPLYVDRWSGGRPDRAGRAYAVNVAGCILGPLVAGFGLLPFLAERHVLFVLALPLFGLAAWQTAVERGAAAAPLGPARAPRALLAATLALAALLVSSVRGYESRFEDCIVRRDATATVIAGGFPDVNKRLIANGQGLAKMTPLAKMMAHLPMASLERPARSALVICFGMGTTFRSLLTWDIDVTAVELTPSVPSLFGFFHADGPALLSSPRARVVIDDGRRFLARTRGSFDVITIDPPPPAETAGSSLLYSRDCYALARARMAPGGILAQWITKEEDETLAAVARALVESFPHVRAFRSLGGKGYHFLASGEALPLRSARDLAERLPARAAVDLVEWGPFRNPERQLADVLGRELDVQAIVARAPGVPALSDDRPVNEYYLVRRSRAR